MGDDEKMKAALNLLYQGITTVSYGELRSRWAALNYTDQKEGQIARHIDKHGGGNSVDIIDSKTHPEWIVKSLNDPSQEWALPDFVDVLPRVEQEGDADLLNGARCSIWMIGIRTHRAGRQDLRPRRLDAVRDGSSPRWLQRGGRFPTASWRRKGTGAISCPRRRSKPDGAPPGHRFARHPGTRAGAAQGPIWWRFRGSRASWVGGTGRRGRRSRTRPPRDRPW